MADKKFQTLELRTFANLSEKERRMPNFHSVKWIDVISFSLIPIVRHNFCHDGALQFVRSRNWEVLPFHLSSEKNRKRTLQKHKRAHTHTHTAYLGVHTQITIRPHRSGKEMAD
jgi:hypothetical protein